jgi:anti-anti-sigma factor
MPDLSGFTAEVAHCDDHAVVVVRGEIDMATADEFRAALDDAIDASGRVEVDLEATTFMDSSGLAVLLAAHRRLGRTPQAIVLRNASRPIRMVLRVSGVAALLDVQAAGDGDGRAPNGPRH